MQTGQLRDLMEIAKREKVVLIFTHDGLHIAPQGVSVFLDTILSWEEVSTMTVDEVIQHATRQR